MLRDTFGWRKFEPKVRVKSRCSASRSRLTHRRLRNRFPCCSDELWAAEGSDSDFATPDYAPPLFELSSARSWSRPEYVSFGLAIRMARNQIGRHPGVRGPRDLRGFFVPNREEGMTAYEGKEACFGLFLSPQCGESSSQAWPLSASYFARFFGSRNYFLGFTRDSYPFLQDRPFYSVAIGTNVFDHSTPIITTELDGAAHSYSDIQIVEAVFGGWGDDIATIKPSCGFSWQILVTGTGDWTEPDYIQVLRNLVRSQRRDGKENGPATRVPRTDPCSVASRRRNISSGGVKKFANRNV